MFQGNPLPPPMGGNMTNAQQPAGSQISPPVGGNIMNAQQPAGSFNNSGSHMNNGAYVGGVPNRPINNSPFGFQHTSNQPFPFQNGMCPIPMAYPQPSLGQFFPNNSSNPPQFFNQGANWQSGQMYMQNSMQHMNQSFTMPLPNHGQFVSGCFNQLPMGVGPQNPTFVPNHQLGTMQLNGIIQQGNQNQHPTIQPGANLNAINQMPGNTGNKQGSLPLPHVVCSVQQQQSQHSCRPYIPGKPQGNSQNEGMLNMVADGQKFMKRNFMHHQSGDASNSGEMKSRYQHGKNLRGRLRFDNPQRRQGHKTAGAGKLSSLNFTNQKLPGNRRSLSWRYTKQEIDHWREERRKNYPSKANTEKKMAGGLTGPVETEHDARRRMEMKEILAKQAELGVEVAEVPEHYLSDTERQAIEKGRRNKKFDKKGSLQGKFNKRGRRQQNGRFSKKQRTLDSNSSKTHNQSSRLAEKGTMPGNKLQERKDIVKREPTLLQKLLSSDIRKDKCRLLQAFRFMVMNSFFKDRYKKPLRFPLVLVREGGVFGEKDPLREARDASEGINNKIVEVSNDVNNVYDGEEGEIVD